MNRHAFDKRIKFRELGHKYWIDGDATNLVSSTTFIHQFFGEFETNKIIGRIVNGRRHKTDPEYAYYQMTASAIKKQWSDNAREASEAGTRMHADIEYFYNNLPVENDSVEYAQFLEFQRDHKHLEMFRTEWMIFAECLRITGSVDAVFRDPEDDMLILGDWKRSKEIRYTPFESGKAGKFPLQHLPDTNFYHYSLQLNLYRVILEKFYGERIKEMFLVICHPGNAGGKYMKLPIARMDKEAELMLDFRKQQLIGLGYPESTFSDLHLDHTVANEVAAKEDDEPEVEVRIQRLL